MYVYERDWNEYGKKDRKNTDLRSVEQRKSEQRRKVQVIGEMRKEPTGLEQNRTERGKSERERRERQLRERRLREKQLQRKRRRKRKIVFFEICLAAAVIMLLVGRDTWMGSLRQWAKRNLAGFLQTEPKAYASSLDGEIYPESLRALLEKNPEAEQFVLNYPKNKDKHPEIDLSGEVTRGIIPLFIQWDERWGYENYGGDFIAVTGCGPTCLSMVYCGLCGDADRNPLQVAQWAEKEGYYVYGTGSSWDLMSYGAEDLGLTQTDVIFDAEHILETLRNGSPIICAMRPGDFTTSGHFIVLSGVDEDGKVIVRDPNSRVRSEKHWSVEDLIPQIKNLWGYQ